MAIRRKKKKEDEQLVDLVEAREQAQDFFERNQNYILGIVGGVILIVGGYFAYLNLYSIPRQERAVEALYQAELQFERDSFALALDSPGGGNEGFMSIIKNYSGTSAANSARYYAGISWLNLGQFDAAIEQLNKFSPKGRITPTMKYGALGDAYSEKGDMAKAEKNYKRAVNSTENELLAPYYLKKLGLLMESQGKGTDALPYYEQIKKEYPNSTEARDIQKYITRLGN